MPDITLFPGEFFFGRLVTGPPSNPIRVSNQLASLITADNRGYTLPMSKVNASNLLASVITVDGNGYEVASANSLVRVSNIMSSLVTVDGVGYEVVAAPFSPARLTQIRVVGIEEADYIAGPPPPATDVRLTQLRVVAVEETNYIPGATSSSVGMGGP